MGELLGIINKESDENDAIACNTMTIRSATSPSHWSKGCISRLDFGGPLLYFNGLEETINVELNPTMDLFKVSKQIGKGAAGKVYQCAYEDAQIKVQYAVKITKVRKHDDIDAYNNNEPREVHIISCLKEPKIVTFYQAWIANECYESNLNEEEASDTYSDTPSDESEFNLHGPKYVLIHMEFCCRTVKEILVVGEREINLEQSWTLFENIAQAVRCVHQKGAIHRDLKPGNIFVGAAGEIKIGDFGHACWARNYIDGQEGTPDRGSDLYAAPELDHGQVTDRVDIYSLGVIFLEIFYPFKSDHERYCLLKDLKSSKYPTDFVGDTLLLKKLTAICPSDRPLANDILEYIGKRQ
uniref:Protein kinase domain-containing protein n=1 Tax=Arundo donax TaxID=35708 RepID=A0A0A8Y726_ARUDO